LDEIIDGAFYESFAIGVFDAKHKCAAVLACKQVVVESCAKATDVEVAGGTRGKAYPDCHLLVSS
jgi:hypothetical protein